MKKVLLALALLGAAHTCPAQLVHPSTYSPSVWPAQTFTASGQWSTIQLNAVAPIGSSFASTVGSSFTSGTITLTGTSLTAVTFTVMGSYDNGKTFFSLPIYTVSAPGQPPATTMTATANCLYRIDLAGVTHVRFSTIGAFNATKVSLLFNASPN